MLSGDFKKRVAVRASFLKKWLKRSLELKTMCKICIRPASLPAGGYALDGEKRPVWEVRPYKDGWHLSIRVKTRWMHHPPACCTGIERCEIELPAASNVSLSAEHTDRTDETDAICEWQHASQTDSGVHWDFSSHSSARRIQLMSHLRGIKMMLNFQTYGVDSWKTVAFMTLLPHC